MELNMDKGLLSRILKKLEQKGYVSRKGVVEDNGIDSIALTKDGYEIYRILNAAANQSVMNIFGKFEDCQIQELMKNMEIIIHIMNND